MDRSLELFFSFRAMVKAKERWKTFLSWTKEETFNSIKPWEMKSENIENAFNKLEVTFDKNPHHFQKKLQKKLKFFIK